MTIFLGWTLVTALLWMNIIMVQRQVQGTVTTATTTEPSPTSYRSEKLSQFWQHMMLASVDDDVDYQHQQDLQDRLVTIRQCLQNSLGEYWGNHTTTTSINTPTIQRTIQQTTTNRTILVHVRQAIPAEQAHSIVTLSDCTSESFPEFREHRAFALGGNEVTFLNILLQLFLPDVTETVYRIAHMAQTAAHWHGKDYPPTRDCGLRTTEYLNYHGYKNLGEHDDAGSLYTVLFALSDPSSYQGGEFFIREDDQRGSPQMHTIKPDQFSAIVFLSTKWHGVTEIKGDRQMFTNELWMYDDPPWSRLRPIQESMAQFMERFDSTEPYNNNDESAWQRHDRIEQLWPQYDETAQWLDETNREWTVDGQFNPEHYRVSAGPYAAEQYQRRFARRAEESGTAARPSVWQQIWGSLVGWTTVQAEL